MPQSNNDRILIDNGASNFAFRISQLVERILLDRSIELASQCGATIVTAEHIKTCLDQSSFDQILKQAGETLNDGTAGESGRYNMRSREAA